MADKPDAFAEMIKQAAAKKAQQRQEADSAQREVQPKKSMRDVKSMSSTDAQKAKKAKQIKAPPEPKTVRDTGLSESYLCDLALKHIYFGGTMEAIEISHRMRLDFQLLAPVFEQLKKQELAMAQGGSAEFGGARIRWGITERGRVKIEEILKRDNYRGPAPVPFDQYIAQLGNQTILDNKVTVEMVDKSFDRLVLDPRIKERIGPAINSGRSIFLYGPPGNGKTSLAECITDTIGGEVYLPHALIVESEIVRVFDDLYHKKVDDGGEPYDKRWVRSKRPVVVVGGELSLDMLDLTVSAQATYYEAPFQVKANSGILFIDDFGRQRCDPQELLNRWIVPLESQFDFMTFQSGQKARTPFDTLIVFSTNLDPKDLVDEAFLRRIRYKIEVGDPTEENFKKIFAIMAKKNGIEYKEDMVDYLIEKHYKPTNRKLRACQPRDLLEQMVDIHKYTGDMPGLTPEVIDRLCKLYFVEL